MAKSWSELIGNAEAEAERCLAQFRRYKRLADRWWDRYEAETKKRDRYAKQSMAVLDTEAPEGDGIRDRLTENAAALGFARRGSTTKEVGEAFGRIYKRTKGRK